jgi:hypothetical protein
MPQCDHQFCNQVRPPIWQDWSAVSLLGSHKLPVVFRIVAALWIYLQLPAMKLALLIAALPLLASAQFDVTSTISSFVPASENVDYVCVFENRWSSTRHPVLYPNVPTGVQQFLSRTTVTSPYGKKAACLLLESSLLRRLVLQGPSKEKLALLQALVTLSLESSPS